VKADPFSDEEKLDILQRNDPFRGWASLDETRFCILCEQVIDGRHIVVFGGPGKPVPLSCPTPGCQGTPYEWVHLGDPLLSDEAYSEWERLMAAAAVAAAERERHPFGFAHLKSVFFPEDKGAGIPRDPL
jgi:hypothetical protein